MNSFILTFRNTHEAMDEERRLKEEGFVMKMIPTPRGISSECGFSIRVDSEGDSITEVLTARKNSIDRIYLQHFVERNKKYEEIYRRQRTGLP